MSIRKRNPLSKLLNYDKCNPFSHIHTGKYPVFYGELSEIFLPFLTKSRNIPTRTPENHVWTQSVLLEGAQWGRGAPPSAMPLRMRNFLF